LASLISHHEGDSFLFDGVFGVLVRCLFVFVAFCTFFFLLMVDNGSLWLLFVLSIMILFLFVFFRAQDFPRRARLIFPVLLLFLAIPFWFWLPGLQFDQIPLEVTLNHESSLHIAEKTLQTYSSTTGSGPGTYLFDFAQFHNTSLNETDFGTRVLIEHPLLP
jgi:energy-coupling factor transporter transmembrane protein EcfT